MPPSRRIPPVGAILTAVLPPAALETYGWPIAFLLGAVAVPFGFWLRTNLPETLHVPAASQNTVDPLSRGQQAFAHRRVLLLWLLVLGSGTIPMYIGVCIVTYTQDTLHMPAGGGFVASSCRFIASVVAILLGGWLSDKYGRCPVTSGAMLPFADHLSHLCPDYYFSFHLLAHCRRHTFKCRHEFYLGFLLRRVTESLRGGGFGIAYSVASAAFGGTTQLVPTWLIHLTGSAMAGPGT